MKTKELVMVRIIKTDYRKQLLLLMRNFLAMHIFYIFKNK